MMGLGIGLIVAVLLMTFFTNVGLSDYELEKRARDLGMMYPEEIKAGNFYEEAVE